MEHVGWADVLRDDVQKTITNDMIKNQGGVFARNSQRMIGLDLFRISLAILIYMFHSWMHFGCSYSILTDFVSVGAIAMTGFFLLSGYSLRLVYGDQDLMEKHNLGKFYLKRILNILPLYYFVAFLYVMFISKETVVENLLLFPIEVLGLQSTFSSIFDISHNGGTWFISCILLAYFIYPFLQTICSQMGNKCKIMVLCVLVLLDIYAVIITHKFDTALLYDNPFYRIVEFACGLLIADINIQKENKILTTIRSSWVLILSAISLIGGVSMIRHYLHYDDYMIYNAIVMPCSCVMLILLGSIRIPSLEKSKSIGYFSKVSYAFFLTQFFSWKIGVWLIELTGYNNNWARILISFTFCLVVSVLMYEVVQKPIDSLMKKRIYAA